jgi:hypothetical protein
LTLPVYIILYIIVLNITNVKYNIHLFNIIVLNIANVKYNIHLFNIIVLNIANVKYNIHNSGNLRSILHKIVGIISSMKYSADISGIRNVDFRLK